MLLARMALPALVAAASPAAAEYATVNFTVSVTGIHNVPNSEGGHRNIEKNRTFSGTARLKFAGRSFSSDKSVLDAKARFKKELDACEQRSSESAIMHCYRDVEKRQNAFERQQQQKGIKQFVAAVEAGPQSEVWATESCSGQVVVADRGSIRGIVATEGYGQGMAEVPYTVDGTVQVVANAPFPERCSFSLSYNPATQTADIAFTTGPGLIPVATRTGGRARGGTVDYHQINPFAWSAVKKFEQAGLKVSGRRGSHTGAWNIATGKPLEYDSHQRQPGEVVTTRTRVTWQFAGTAPPASKKTHAPNNSHPIVDPIRMTDEEDVISNCLAELRRRTGRETPAMEDTEALMKCMTDKKHAK